MNTTSFFPNGILPGLISPDTLAVFLHYEHNIKDCSRLLYILKGHNMYYPLVDNFTLLLDLCRKNMWTHGSWRYSLPALQIAHDAEVTDVKIWACKIVAKIDASNVVKCALYQTSTVIISFLNESDARSLKVLFPEPEWADAFNSEHRNSRYLSLPWLDDPARAHLRKLRSEFTMPIEATKVIQANKCLDKMLWCEAHKLYKRKVWFVRYVDENIAMDDQTALLRYDKMCLQNPEFVAKLDTYEYGSFVEQYAVEFVLRCHVRKYYGYISTNATNNFHNGCKRWFELNPSLDVRFEDVRQWTQKTYSDKRRFKFEGRKKVKRTRES
jgi:hypothetical protein